MTNTRNTATKSADIADIAKGLALLQAEAAKYGVKA